jgi:ATP-binding cassette subfamily B protein
MMGISYALQLLGQRAMHDLRCQLHRHVLTRSAAFFDRTPLGRLVTGITSDVEAINMLFTGGVVTSLIDLTVLLAIVSMMLYLSVQLTVVVLLSALLLVPMFRWTRTKIRDQTRAFREQLSTLASFVIERLAGALTVQTQAREDREIRAHGEKCAAYSDASYGAFAAAVVPYPVTEGVAFAAAAFVLWYSGTRFATGLTVGLVVAFVEYTDRLFGPLQSLTQKFSLLQSAMASAERIFALLDTTDADAPPRAALPASTGTEPAPTDAGAAIEFSDVVFGYQPNVRVLHGVSLVVPRGSTVAVVGATGSGKSTLVRLLARHYQPQAGAIYLDGRDVRDVPTPELRRRLTLISQDVFLFSGTIADNIRLGHPDATDADVQAALDRVGASERLRPDIKIVERGANLSHGERQLVAFARALVRDPQVLLLDEATAHVDPETEQLIERALEKMFVGRTSLIIAHRLVTVRRADRIIVMSGGNIIEAGTRDELLARGGAYARLEATGSLAE